MRGLKHKFRCGDKVCDPVDPRHVGRIVLVDSGLWATVLWENGWRTENLKLDRLQLVNEPANDKHYVQNALDDGLTVEEVMEELLELE